MERKIYEREVMCKGGVLGVLRALVLGMLRALVLGHAPCV